MATTDPFEPARRRKRRIGWYLVAVGAFLALREIVEGSPITNLATNLATLAARRHSPSSTSRRLGSIPADTIASSTESPPPHRSAATTSPSGKVSRLVALATAP